MAVKSPLMRAAITFLSPEQVERSQQQIRSVYFEAFAAPPYSRDQFVADNFLHSLLRQMDRPDFRFAAAIDEAKEQIVGFAYGHSTAPGQWWHDLVALGLGPQRAATWLASSFELVEFAVAPHAQGNHLGSQLHDRLLAEVPHRTAVLSTLQAETVALQLYRKRGWVVLLERFLFPGGSRPFLIMGLDLARWQGRAAE